ncbi:Antitoxin VapB [invertebrate metagenome]|uniref:Antitoxin VapB n=1 Tax=invertebrate metagenome TaxID=1711999 RepID=A0A2H9T377_9ZZZZ
MAKGSVFINNRTQAVRLPVETRFPDNVKQVKVRVVGQDRILSPVEHTWDSFFLADDSELMDDDFLSERATQEQSDREDF